MARLINLSNCRPCEITDYNFKKLSQDNDLLYNNFLLLKKMKERKKIIEFCPTTDNHGGPGGHALCQESAIY